MSYIAQIPLQIISIQRFYVDNDFFFFVSTDSRFFVKDNLTKTILLVVKSENGLY
jgi:hypothetical protein